MNQIVTQGASICRAWTRYHGLYIALTFLPRPENSSPAPNPRLPGEDSKRTGTSNNELFSLSSQCIWRLAWATWSLPGRLCTTIAAVQALGVSDARPPFGVPRDTARALMTGATGAVANAPSASNPR